MPETIKEPEQLEFTAHASTSGILEIEAKNVTGGKLDNQLLVEIKLPRSMVNNDIRAAAELAAGNAKTKNMASLLGVVTAAEGWSVFAYNDADKKMAAVRAYNYLNQETAEEKGVPATLEAGARLTLRIPLNPEALNTHNSISFRYQYGGRKNKFRGGSLDVNPPGPIEWKPQVSLTTDKPNPNSITPGEKVIISWRISDAVSAVLRGPLSGGHSELTLSSDKDSRVWIEKGWVETYAVGPATYILDAEVRGPAGQPNAQVVRTLLIDIYSSAKHANVSVRPNNILPNGEVQVYWTVWGIHKASLRIGKRKEINLELTEKDSDRNFQGTGIWPLNALSNQEVELVRLTVENDQDFNAPVDAWINVTPWEERDKVRFTGKPIAMAVAVPKLALLATDGLRIKHVGINDQEKESSFLPASGDGAKAWLALTAFDKDFVVLRQSEKETLQLARYTADGNKKGLPIDLPGTFETIVRQPDAFFDIAALGDRVFVVGQSSETGARRSCSVRFDAQELPRREPRLERLFDSRLLAFNGGLYAINRDSGKMLRFNLTEKGELARPLQAASAVKNDQSLLRAGVFIPAGEMLVLLGSGLLPSERLEPVVFNIPGLSFMIENLTLERDCQNIPQDLVYNPQKDEWTRCGHGLRIEPGAVAAYRGGRSKRLWVLQPNGQMHSLTGASEKLFAPDYVEGFPKQGLPPYLNKKRKFEVTTHIWGFGPMSEKYPMSENYSRAGLSNVSSTVPVEVTLLPDHYGVNHTIELEYNEADPAPVTVRYMGGRDQYKAHPNADFMLEVTFYGPDLSRASTVLRRIGFDRQGKLTNDEYFGTRLEHSTNSTIALSPNFQIDRNAEIKFYIVNTAPIELTAKGLKYYSTVLHPVINNTDSYTAMLTHYTADFSLAYKGSPADDELLVNINLALPPGIEVSSGKERQRYSIRINTDNAKSLEVLLAQMLKPGERPLKLAGSRDSLYTNNQPAYVCQVGRRQ